MSSEDAQLQGRIDELNQRLQLSEERLRCLMNLSADGILIVDTAGTIQVANPAAVALFSHLSSTLVGCTFGYPLLAENGVEIDLVQDNGAMRVLEMRGAATTWNEAAAIMISLREITEGAEPKDAAHGLRAQLEQQREREMAELRAANADLERAASLKDEFLATMSHELRTPLNAILSLARILHEQLGSILSARQHQSFDVISESGHHLLEIINDILDLTKVQSGMMTLNIESVPVEQLCTSALHVVRQAAEQKQLELRVAIEPDIVAIQADRLRVKQILLNLLSNAVKFTPDGGAIGLEVRKRPDAGYVDFAVWDTGIGIAHSDLDRLFKPFVQLPSSASHNIPGTGLGLALAAKLARQHGGDISVESRIGEGSRFTLTLPWNADDRLPLPIADVAAEPSKAHSGENQRLILLAEDNEANIFAIREYLELSGFQVHVARTGPEALETALSERPDLVLMDINMPRLDGIEVIRRLRSDEHAVHIPIVTVTAMSDDRERSLAAGANHYLSKPIDLDKLDVLLNHYFG